MEMFFMEFCSLPDILVIQSFWLAATDNFWSFFVSLNYG